MRDLKGHSNPIQNDFLINQCQEGRGRELGHDLTLDKEGEDGVVMTETGGVTSLTHTRHTIAEGDDLLCTRVEIPERMNDVRDEFWS